jgi:hypothetical protein
VKRNTNSVPLHEIVLRDNSFIDSRIKTVFWVDNGKIITLVSQTGESGMTGLYDTLYGH